MLRTDYKDDILQEGQTQRKYTMTTSGGYSYFTDATAYSQVGDVFGAAVINATNAAVNKCVEYASGTLVAGQVTLTVHAPNGSPGFFFDGGHVEVYVPSDKVQDLVVASTSITPQSGSTPSKCVVTFSSSVNSDSTIDVYCK